MSLWAYEKLTWIWKHIEVSFYEVTKDASHPMLPWDLRSVNTLYSSISSKLTVDWWIYSLKRNTSVHFRSCVAFNTTHYIYHMPFINSLITSQQNRTLFLHCLSIFLQQIQVFGIHLFSECIFFLQTFKGNFIDFKPASYSCILESTYRRRVLNFSILTRYLNPSLPVGEKYQMVLLGGVFHLVPGAAVYIGSDKANARCC